MLKYNVIYIVLNADMFFFASFILLESFNKRWCVCY